MADSTYRDPDVTLNRIYTRHGDGGETRLVGGATASKDSVKLEAYGTIDELGAFVGQARLSALEGAAAAPRLGRLAAILLRVQHELFNLGSMLATPPADLKPQQPRVAERDVAQLEREIDAANLHLPPLPSFVLAGGSRLSVELHLCRTVCRRAERIICRLAREEAVDPLTLSYVNRLSDAFFVWSRWACNEAKVEETLWEPNRAASAQAGTTTSEATS